MYVCMYCMHCFLGDWVCPSACALANQQVHSALHRRTGSEPLPSGLLSVAVGGPNPRRRQEVPRKIRDIRISANARFESLALCLSKCMYACMYVCMYVE